MSRQTKNCIQCGVPVEIVPAGISKKTGKPYSSFAKCKECGFSEQLSDKPKVNSAQKTDAIVLILTEISKGIARLVEIKEQEHGAQAVRKDNPFPTGQ